MDDLTTSSRIETRADATEPGAQRRSRFRRLRQILLLLCYNSGAVLLGLLLLDVSITKLGLLELRAMKSGIERVGFASPVERFGGADARLRVAILGDSHLQWVRRHGDDHQSPMLQKMLEDAGLSSEVVALGTPRYAPIQELVAYETLIKPAYGIDIAIFLVYAGNDFLETLRRDDRPRAERDAAGRPYIADPRWVLQRVRGGNNQRWPEDSRLLYLMNSATPNNLVFKVLVADRVLESFDASLAERAENVATLWRFTDRRLGYPGAVPAQFLYQYFLYTRHPEVFRDEVRWRLTYFFEEFRRLNPELETYVFFLPSAPAIQAMPALDQAVLDDVLDRSGLGPLDFAALEGELFELLHEARDASGADIPLIDLSEPLRSANLKDGTQTFYDEPTLHIDTEARRVVAREFARVIRAGAAAQATSTFPEPPISVQRSRTP